LLRGNLSQLTDEERLQRIRLMTKKNFFSENFFEWFVEIIKQGELLYKVLFDQILRYLLAPALILIVFRISIVFLTFLSPMLLDSLISQMQRKELIDENQSQGDATQHQQRNPSDEYFLKDYYRNLLIICIGILSAYFFNGMP
jgi:hypothetical protein